MNGEVKLCDFCNGEVIKVKEDNKVAFECSYCGKRQDSGYEIGGFIPEFDGEDE